MHSRSFFANVELPTITFLKRRVTRHFASCSSWTIGCKGHQMIRLDAQARLVSFARNLSFVRARTVEKSKFEAFGQQASSRSQAQDSQTSQPIVGAGSIYDPPRALTMLPPLDRSRFDRYPIYRLVIAVCLPLPLPATFSFLPLANM